MVGLSLPYLPPLIFFLVGNDKVVLQVLEQFIFYFDLAFLVWLFFGFLAFFNTLSLL